MRAITVTLAATKASGSLLVELVDAMRAITVTLAACIVSAGPALAEECRVEEWRHDYDYGVLSVEGVTTCRTGQITLRFYDGEGDTREFIGAAATYIHGHVFQSMKLIPRPTALSVKYSIETR